MGYPGSQDLNSLAISHTMNYYKTFFEIFILLLVSYPAIRMYQAGEKLFPTIFIVLSLLTYILLNFKFTAEYRFRQPKNLVFQLPAANAVEKSMQIIGVEINGKTKAYPVSFVRYHHQIVDSIYGKIIIVTYCGLCRTGRVYEPYVNNEYETFRLVGINHNNAMFEDKRTKSWWSQETGVCIAGELKGKRLKEVDCNNMILQKWMELYPETGIMQPDPLFIRRYLKENDFTPNAENPVNPQKGGTWLARTFIIGISVNSFERAYEWNYLVKARIIRDKIGGADIILVNSIDNKSFAAFEVPNNSSVMLRNDTIVLNNKYFNFTGRNLASDQMEMKKIRAYKEYWFSWLFAHPNTSKYTLD